MSGAQLDVFVGNLSASATEEGLREMFGTVGQVRGVRLLLDKETGRPKGYAFVEYFSADSVAAAVRLLDKSDYNGRPLRVSFASGSGGGAGGGGGGGAYDDGILGGAKAGTIAGAVAGLQLHEAWDVLDLIKKLNETQQLRPFLETNPQLVAAAHELQRRLGIVGSGN
jgi:RNA recognition motif-containing protein